jgi:hypothetical protein
VRRIAEHAWLRGNNDVASGAQAPAVSMRRLQCAGECRLADAGLGAAEPEMIASGTAPRLLKIG